MVVIVVVVGGGGGGGGGGGSSSSHIYHTTVLLTAKETNLLLSMRIHTLRKWGQDHPSTELLRRNFFPTLLRRRLQGCQLTDSKHWRCRRYVPSIRRKDITRTHSATALQYWFPNTWTGWQLYLSVLCPFPRAMRQWSRMTRVRANRILSLPFRHFFAYYKSMRKYGCITPALSS